MGKGLHLKRSASRFLLVTGLLLLAGGCAETHDATPYFVLPRQPDDIRLYVMDLRYHPDTSGYTFKYNEKDAKDPCDVTRWAYVRKDALVGMRAIDPPCQGKGKDFAEVWLRRDWDGAPKPVTREELERIPALPTRRAG